MQGHAQKCVERYCELASRRVEQLCKVSNPCLDHPQFEQEELESVGELSEVCPITMSNPNIRACRTLVRLFFQKPRARKPKEDRRLINGLMRITYPRTHFRIDETRARQNSKAKTENDKRRQKVDRCSDVDYVPTDALLKVSFSCIFLKTVKLSSK